MKTLTTITIDGDLKEKVQSIIQNELKTSLSQEVEKLCKYIIKNHKGVEIDNGE